MMFYFKVKLHCIYASNHDQTQNVHDSYLILQDAGDFAEVAYFVLQNRCSSEGKLTLEEVNSDLGKYIFPWHYFIVQVMN